MTRSGKQIIVEGPIGLMTVDFLDMGSEEKVLVAIDYFFRFVFAKIVTSKNAEKILDFIKEVFNKFKFKMLLSDNGKEFSNVKMTTRLPSNSIKQKLAVPYYHNSIGRVERVDKTLRSALAKTTELIKLKLKKVSDNYNNSVHRGINMTPVEAFKPENEVKVIEHEKKYAKESNR